MPDVRRLAHQDSTEQPGGNPMTVRLHTTARCRECDWTATGPNADKEAEKHMKTTKHHSTETKSEPQEEK